MKTKTQKEQLEAERLLLERRLVSLPDSQVEERVEVRTKLIRVITQITLLN